MRGEIFITWLYIRAIVSLLFLFFVPFLLIALGLFSMYLIISVVRSVIYAIRAFRRTNYLDDVSQPMRGLFVLSYSLTCLALIMLLTYLLYQSEYSYMLTNPTTWLIVIIAPGMLVVLLACKYINKVLNNQTPVVPYFHPSLNFFATVFRSFFIGVLFLFIFFSESINSEVNGTLTIPIDGKKFTEIFHKESSEFTKNDLNDALKKIEKENRLVLIKAVVTDKHYNYNQEQVSRSRFIDTALKSMTSLVAFFTIPISYHDYLLKRIEEKQRIKKQEKN